MSVAGDAGELSLAELPRLVVSPGRLDRLGAGLLLRGRTSEFLDARLDAPGVASACWRATPGLGKASGWLFAVYVSSSTPTFSSEHTHRMAPEACWVAEGVAL